MDNKQLAPEMLGKIDGIFQKLNLEGVSAESSGMNELPDGYYLGEVASATLGESKSSHAPMVTVDYKVVEDGFGTVTDENGDVTFTEVKSKGRHIYVYYLLTDESKAKRFVSDMLKFEGDVEGEPLLPEEAFTNSETIMDALEVLTGCRIYLQISTSINKTTGEANSWKNPISWKRAAKLELPM